MPSRRDAQQIGRTAEVFALGRTWRIGRFDKDVWDDLLDWAAPRIYNQLEYLKPIIQDMPPEVTRAIVSEALTRCPRSMSITEPAFQHVIDGTPEGKVRRLWLLLRKEQPDVTEQEAFEILKEIGEQEEQRALEKAAGKLPPRDKSPGTGRHDAAANGSADQLADRDEFPDARVPPAPVGCAAPDPR